MCDLIIYLDLKDSGTHAFMYYETKLKLCL